MRDDRCARFPSHPPTQLRKTRLSPAAAASCSQARSFYFLSGWARMIVRPQRGPYTDGVGGTNDDRAQNSQAFQSCRLVEICAPTLYKKFEICTIAEIFSPFSFLFILHRFLSSGDVTAVHLAERRLVWLYCRPVLVHRACSERRPALTARIRRSFLTAGSSPVRPVIWRSHAKRCCKKRSSLAFRSSRRK